MLVKKDKKYLEIARIIVILPYEKVDFVAVTLGYYNGYNVNHMIRS